MEKVRVEISGVGADRHQEIGAVRLLEVEGERGITMVIGLFELRAIALEMEGIKTPRPMTHDLMKNIIDEAGLALSEITITELRDNTFYAVLSLGPYEIDARPSDAIRSERAHV